MSRTCSRAFGNRFVHSDLDVLPHRRASALRRAGPRELATASGSRLDVGTFGVHPSGRLTDALRPPGPPSSLYASWRGRGLSGSATVTNGPLVVWGPFLWVVF
jgi:hypothetical protein